MDSPNLEQYKQNPKVGAGKRAWKLAKDNWIIVSLLVVIVAISVYGIRNGQRNKLPTDDDSKVIPSGEDGQDPPYWIQGFDKGGHFTNFTVVIIDELARNFHEVDKAKFNLNASERILDRQNWKSLFNYTEQIVKGMKLISLQDDVLKNKLREFENAEADFEQCKLALLKGNELMENDSEELITANRTIAHEEGILELLRDDLSLFQSLRQGEINKTNIQINQKIKEKQQLEKIFEQTIDKDQYIKELQNQYFSLEQNVEELKGQIRLQQEMKKASSQKYRQNEELSKELFSELGEITFDIQRLELNLEIDEIVGRVKREEQINNTRQLTQIIQKRIKLINSHRIHSASISDELIKTFESDKNQLKDLNNLQINLIRSFRQQAVSQGGKNLEQLKQEEALKKRLLEQVRSEIDGRDGQATDFENTIAELEQKIRDGQDEMEQLQIKIKELEQTLGTQGDVNAEKIKEKIIFIEEAVNVLKQQRSIEESGYQQKLSEKIDEIQKQKDHIKIVQQSFSKLIARRQTLEKGILADLNKCRSFRYLMNTIQQSAIESQEKAKVTKHKLYQIKNQLKDILDFMIPEAEESYSPEGNSSQPDLTQINEEIQQLNLE